MGRSQKPPVLEAWCIEGPAATGKTEWLIQRVAQLLGNGTSEKDIVLFAATPEAARQLKRRLEAALHPGSAPLVCTIFEHEMALLSLPQTVQTTKRAGRIMLRYEENIFLEDMKTSGVQPRRLAEMLKFFYRSCSNLEPMDYGWFYSDEEENTYELLNQLLNYYECYIRPLVGWSAYEYAKQNPTAYDELRFDHVLVDDYPLLSTASQKFAELIAQKSLTVAGDAFAQVAPFEEYPNPKGLEDFKSEHSDANVVSLEKSYISNSVAQAINTLVSDEVFAAPNLHCARAQEGQFGIHESKRPQDEFEAIAVLIQKLQEAGYSYQDIAIAVPTHTWEKNVAEALVQHNIACSLLHQKNVGGDVRSLETSFNGRILSVLRLLANPQDQIALRSWCGFGDYLANSALFTSLCKVDAKIEIDTTSIQTVESSTLFEQQSSRSLDALSFLRNLKNRVSNLKGQKLVEAIAEALEPGRPVSKHLLHLWGNIEPNASAADLMAKIDNEVFLGTFMGEGVRICLPEQLVGQNASCIVLAGLSNGLIPASRYFDPTNVERDKRAPILASEIARIYTAAGKASCELHISYFTEALLGDAEQFKLKFERVRLRNGQRVCEIHPSEAIRSITGVRFDD